MNPRERWPLLVLAKSPDHKLSPVQMQKTLFILSKTVPKVVGSNYYAFRPYNFGPFDISIYNDLDHLSSLGLVRKIPGQQHQAQDFQLTDLGVTVTQSIIDHGDFEPPLIEYVTKLVDWVKSLSFRQLVEWVYANYPEYKENSVFQGPQ